MLVTKTLLFLPTASLEPTYRQLQMMKLDKSPFVIISVIGQELLAQVKEKQTNKRQQTIKMSTI